MARKKPAKEKKKSRMTAIVADLEKTDVVRELTAKEKEFAKKLGKATKEVDHILAANKEVQKLKKEIKEKPLLYTALALTAGIALGAILRGRH